MAEESSIPSITFSVTVQRAPTPLMFAAAVGQLADAFEQITQNEVAAALEFVSATFKSKPVLQEIGRPR